MQHYTQWRSSPQHTHAHKQRNILFYVQGNENKDWQLLSPSASNNKLLAIVEFWFKYLSKSDIKILILSSEKIIVSWENKKFHQTGKKKKIPIVYFLKKMYFEHELSCAVLSCSVMSDSLPPHGLQHARPPCPSPTPGAYSNSCPLSRDAMQPPHLLSLPSPPTFNLSQHQGLFQWASSSHQVVKILELQQESFWWIFSWFPLGLTGLIL